MPFPHIFINRQNISKFCSFLTRKLLWDMYLNTPPPHHELYTNQQFQIHTGSIFTEGQVLTKAKARYLEPGRRPATKARRSQHPGSAPASFYLLYDLQIFEILLSKFQKEPPLQFRMQCCIFCVAEYSLYYDDVTAYIFEKHLRKKELIRGYFGAQSSELLEKTLLVSPKNVYTFFCIFSKSETLIKWVHSEKECVR